MHALHLLSDNEKVMTRSNKNIIIDHFRTLFTRHQQYLETSLKRNDLAFISIKETRYKAHKISLNRGGLYIDTLK